MPGFSRRPLAVFVCCLFAGTQAGYAAIDHEWTLSSAADSSAQEDSQALLLAANDQPLTLRKERKFDVLEKKMVPVDKAQAP